MTTLADLEKRARDAWPKAMGEILADLIALLIVDRPSAPSPDARTLQAVASEVPRVTSESGGPHDYPHVCINGESVFQHSLGIESEAVAALQRWFAAHWPAAPREEERDMQRIVSRLREAVNAR